MAWRGVSNLRFSNIRVDTDFLIDAKNTSPDKPIDGLTIQNVTGTCKRGIVLSNIKNADLRDIHVSGFDGAFLTTTNVTGTGINGASSP